jgi:hypothetical protein|nr:MAG TPA: hypothetical protein [Caudoviricetes sp.]
MKKILQAQVIYDAFMDTILRRMPKKEKDYPAWYKDRLDKCNDCKYNTKNIPNSILPTGSLYFSKMLGKNRCSICTCFIKQKAWSKTEECAMAETNERPSWLPYGYVTSDKDNEPKWNRLELITMDSDEFNLVSVDGKKYNTDISEDGEKFLIKLIPTKKGNDIDFSFILQSRHNIVITRIDAGCGCIEPTLDLIDKKNHKIGIHLNTNVFGIGNFVKDFSVHYKIEGKEYKDDVDDIIDIKFLGKIQ